MKGFIKKIALFFLDILYGYLDTEGQAEVDAYVQKCLELQQEVERKKFEISELEKEKVHLGNLRELSRKELSELQTKFQEIQNAKKEISDRFAIEHNRLNVQPDSDALNAALPKPSTNQ